MGYNKGMQEYAKRRAANIFDKWNDCTGVVVKHSSCYWEIIGVIEEAVECGAQAALGVEHKLEGEEE